jgi:hypothetical protein
VTVPGICSSDRIKADLPRHARQSVDKPRAWIIAAACHKDMCATWRSADSTPIRKLSDSAGTCLMMSTSAERQRFFPVAGSHVRRDDQR